VIAVDTLMTKVLQGTLRLLAQAFFCCRRPVSSVIPLQSVSFSLNVFILMVNSFVFIFIVLMPLFGPGDKKAFNL